jgi:hypothetical protein
MSVAAFETSYAVGRLEREVLENAESLALHNRRQLVVSPS